MKRAIAALLVFFFACTHPLIAQEDGSDSSQKSQLLQDIYIQSLDDSGIQVSAEALSIISTYKKRIPSGIWDCSGTEHLKACKDAFADLERISDHPYSDLYFTMMDPRNDQNARFSAYGILMSTGITEYGEGVWLLVHAAFDPRYTSIIGETERVLLFNLRSRIGGIRENVLSPLCDYFRDQVPVDRIRGLTGALELASKACKKDPDYELFLHDTIEDIFSGNSNDAQKQEAYTVLMSLDSITHNELVFLTTSPQVKENSAFHRWMTLLAKARPATHVDDQEYTMIKNALAVSDIELFQMLRSSKHREQVVAIAALGFYRDEDVSRRELTSMLLDDANVDVHYNLASSLLRRFGDDPEIVELVLDRMLNGPQTKSHMLASALVRNARPIPPEVKPYLEGLLLKYQGGDRVTSSTRRFIEQTISLIDITEQYLAEDENQENK